MTKQTVFALATSCALFWSSSAVLAAEAVIGVQGDPAAGQEKSATCAACHGADGNSASPQWPKLANQHAAYIVKQLHNFQDGERVNAVMQGMAAPLSDDDINNLAVYFATQELKPGLADKDQIGQGETLYRGGDPERGVPACSGCHGPAGRGNAAAKFPHLGGQHAEYTVAQLKMFRAGERANDPNGMMRGVAVNMTDQQIEAVASYIQGLRQ